MLQKTVERNLMTHHAARNFRSYWHYHRKEPAEFKKLIVETWTGVEIDRLEQHGRGEFGRPDMRIAMWCTEDRIRRELYWLGFGF